jgi:hypothetical protein
MDAPTRAATAPTAPTSAVASAVNADFARLCRRHRHLAPMLAGIADRHPDDTVLAELLVRARHDELVARVLVQRLVPALVSLARRHDRRGPGGRQEAFDVLLATAWELVRTYPLERRPNRILANLVCDAEYRAFTREDRRRWTRAEVPGLAAGSPHDRAVEAPPHPAEVLVGLLRDAQRAGLPADDVRLLGRLHLSGASPDAVAAAEGYTTRTLRTRRRRAEQRLGALVSAGIVAA